MATLQIRKETSKVWRHIPSDEFPYIVSKLYIKSEGDNIRVVELGGSQRGIYNFADVSVYDIGGVAETFTSASELMQRLEALGYIGFFYEGEVSPSTLISADLGNIIELGSDGKLYAIGGGSSTWGSITGTLSDQTDLQNALDSKLDKSTTPSSVYATDASGNQEMILKSSLGQETKKKKSRWWASGGTTPTTLSQDLALQNYPLIYTGTKQNPAVVTYANTMLSSIPRLVYRSGAGAGSSCGFKTGGSSVYPFSTSVGYDVTIYFDTSNLPSVPTSRISAGITRNTADIGNVNPSSLLNSVLVGNDTGDTNLWLMHNDGTGTCTRFDLGVDFPHNTENTFYALHLRSEPNGTEVYWKLERYQNSPILATPIHSVEGVINSDLPTFGALCWFVHRNNNTTASAVEVGISYVENKMIY